MCTENRFTPSDGIQTHFCAFAHVKPVAPSEEKFSLQKCGCTAAGSSSAIQTSGPFFFFF